MTIAHSLFNSKPLCNFGHYLFVVHMTSALADLPIPDFVYIIPTDSRLPSFHVILEVIRTLFEYWLPSDSVFALGNLVEMQNEVRFRVYVGHLAIQGSAKDRLPELLILVEMSGTRKEGHIVH